MKLYLIGIFVVFLISASYANSPDQKDFPGIESCVLTYDTPSDASGALPLGNGDIGVSAWIEPSGDLIMLIGKTDAWSEHGALLKLGKLRVRLDIPLSTEKEALRQVLDMSRGTLRIESILRNDPNCKVSIMLWVDANHPVIHVDMESSKPVGLVANIESWRTEERELTVRSSANPTGWHYIDGFSGQEPARLYADTIVQAPAPAGLKNHLVWYYRNKPETIYPVTLNLEGLQDFEGEDPLIDRTFGCSVGGPGVITKSPDTIVSGNAARKQSLTIHPLTMQKPTAEDWLAVLSEQTIREEQRNKKKCFTEHVVWWNAFWNRSWIQLGTSKPGDSPEVSQINTGWHANRYIVACGARGAYPVKFNGSIFNVEGFDRDGNEALYVTPDYRDWGSPFWFQNQRHIYWPMLQAGDYEQFLPFFKMYKDALPLALHRSKVYYGHGGAFFPETQYFWGVYSPQNYGWDRSGKELGLTDNGYIRRYWQGGLELTAMMLAWYRHTGDEETFKTVCFPVMVEVLNFYDEHYKRDAEGKIRFYPAQVLESVWDAENPMPEIAGLKYTLNEMLSLPEYLVSEKHKNQWKRLLSELPPLPQENMDGKVALKDAKIIHGGRHNMENALLYAIWPYRLFGKSMPRYDVALESWKTRPVKFANHSCWHNDILWAAYLGLPDQARMQLANRFVLSGDFRFPAMYINGDWTPDHDNGGVCQNTIQTMLMQTIGDQILLFPAWPREWDVDFKLHAPKNTTVECRLENGEIVSLKVVPESRSGDFVISYDIQN